MYQGSSMTSMTTPKFPPQLQSPGSPMPVRRQMVISRSMTTSAASCSCGFSDSNLNNTFSSKPSRIIPIKNDRNKTKSHERFLSPTPATSTTELIPSKSVSLDDVQLSSHPETKDAFKSNDSNSDVINLDTKGPKWSKTKEIYKTGLYAHWWLNASLQPITEESHTDKLSENL